jgi:CRP-like cAMP-binding protein
MDTNEKRAVLSQSTLFDNLLTTELTMLADLFVAKDYEAGELVFDEGVVGDSMYVIESGSVEVLRKNPQGEYQQIAVLGEKKFFGEMSLIDKEYRSATVLAREPARLLQLSNENLHIFARNYRNGFTWVVVNIARVLSERLREINRRYTERL